MIFGLMREWHPAHGKQFFKGAQVLASEDKHSENKRFTSPLALVCVCLHWRAQSTCVVQCSVFAEQDA